MAGLGLGGAAQAARQRALSAFYVGEAVKLAVVIVVLFVLVLKWMKVAPLAMLAAFAATFLVYWIALLERVAGRWARSRRGA